MPTKQIVQYRAAWDLNDHFGIIQMRAENGSWSPSKKIDDPQEFQLILDLFRNEKPMYLKVNNDRVKTAEERIGEEE